jgi:murein DD-endopeptidase MepM/ murein hydrolase activator NlpD
VPIFHRWRAISSSWNNLFRDHEIIVRTDGHVRFLTLRAGLQRRAAAVVAAGAGLWLTGTAALLGWQAWTSHQAQAVAQRAVAVEQAEVRVAAEKRSAEDMARGVEARQAQLEALVERHFGDDLALPATPAAAPANPTARLQVAVARQDALVTAMTDAAARRTTRAEAALQRVGLKAQATAGRGGPFLPWRTREKEATADPPLKSLSSALDRMAQAESLLHAVPSHQPADGALSSGFGVRYDPFNGAPAVHAGLDFTGAHGSPIRAAAPGRVSFVGVRSGYGNVVEVDHGHGLMTRYAHLSRFAAREGDDVAAGAVIAHMGSTGRSTGTHLHFEVRVNGAAVNPRRFLEANRHVLEAKDA